MTRPKFIAGAIVWLAAGFIGLGMFYFITPQIESRVAPVLDFQTVDNVERQPGKVCWLWTWNKARYAQPIVIAWSIVLDGTAVEYPAVVERRRDGEVIRKPRASALGPGRNELCATIPSELDRVKNLTIRGQAHYAVSHGLWTIWQELPAVEVPELRGSD